MNLDVLYCPLFIYDCYLWCFDFQEFEIDKLLGIRGPEDVEKMGIEAYNAECRKIVMRYADEWEVTFCKVCLLSARNSSAHCHHVVSTSVQRRQSQ